MACDRARAIELDGTILQSLVTSGRDSFETAAAIAAGNRIRRELVN